MKYLPEGATAMFELLVVVEEEDVVGVTMVSTKGVEPQAATEKKDINPTMIDPDEGSLPPVTKKLKIAPSLSADLPDAVNLEEFESVKQVMELGMDRIKAALVAMQCKCGGTLEE